jgi:hypothetical protein
MTSPKVDFKYAANFDPPQRSERSRAIVAEVYGRKVFVRKNAAAPVAAKDRP